MRPAMFREMDLVALDDDGRVRLLVEAKARRRVDQAWADTWRSMLLARRPQIAHQPLLLVSPDQIFFWPAAAGPGPRSPLAANAAPLLKDYLTAIGRDEWIDPTVFEAVVRSWLDDVNAGKVHLDALGDAGQSLESILRGATLMPRFRIDE